MEDKNTQFGGFDMAEIFELLEGVAPIILGLAFALVFVVFLFYQLFCFLERRFGRRTAIVLYLIATAIALFSIFPFWWAVGIYAFILCAPQFDKELTEMGKAHSYRKMYEAQMQNPKDK